MNAPRVSVVMSVFNGAAHLAETLESLLAQTMSDFEVVAIDDGSTDGTLPILAEYARRDERIRLVTQANVGLTRALVHGCAEARAPLIARQDAGDISEPRRLESEMAAFDASPELVFCSCWTAFVGPELEPMYVARGTGQAGQPASIINLDHEWAVIDGPTAHGAVMFRRDAYENAGGYRPEFYYGQDWDLWYRLAQQGKYQTIENIFYKSRIAAEGISGSSRKAQSELSKLSRRALIARMEQGDDSEIVGRAARVRPTSKRSARCRRARGNYFIGEVLRRNGDARALDYFRKALTGCPLLLRAWIRYVQALRLLRRTR